MGFSVENKKLPGKYKKFYRIDGLIAPPDTCAQFLMFTKSRCHFLISYGKKPGHKGLVLFLNLNYQ
jgi:hypothetical protein